MRDASGKSTGGVRALYLILAVHLAVAYLGPSLVSTVRGPMPLSEPSEARYAEISREMLAAGDWFTPRLNGIKHLHKPPLTYWVTAASMGLFGVSERGARAPLPLVSLGTVVLTWLLGRAIFGQKAGLLAAFVLSSSVLFLSLSRILATDAYLLFFCTAAFHCGWQTLDTGRPAWLLGLYLSLALGVLTKGHMGLIVPLAPLLAAFWVLRRYGAGPRRPGPAWHLAGLLLFCLVALPWYVAICHDNPGLALYFAGKALGPAASSSGMHGGPFYTYLLVLLGGLFPWSLLLPPAFALLFRPGRGGWVPQALMAGVPNEGGSRNGPEGAYARRRAAALFLATGSLGWIGFISALPAKLPAYILPTVVPLALVMGNWLARQRAGRWTLYLVPALMLFMAAALPLVLRMEQAEHVLAIAGGCLTGLSVGLAALALLAWALLGSRAFRAALLTAALASSWIYLIAAWQLPVVTGSRSCPRELVEEVLAQSDRAARIVNLRVFVISIPFYTGRRVVLVDYPRETRFEEAFEAAARRDRRAARNFYHMGRRPTRRLLYEPARSLWITREEHMDYVRELKPDVEEILHAGHLVLFANRKTGVSREEARREAKSLAASRAAARTSAPH